MLTVAQRCADWFIMREFRLTSTSAASILLKCPEYRECMGLRKPHAWRNPPSNSSYESPSEILETLSKDWFSRNRSVEDMLRGTVNEDAVLNASSQLSFIDSIYKIGMVCHKNRPWLGASVDCMAVFDYNVCKPDYFPESEERDLCLAPVEIKTAIGRDFVARGTNVASADLLICDMDTDVFKQRVPRERIAQLVHHCISCNMRWVFYVHASESQILYVILARCNRALFPLCICPR